MISTARAARTALAAATIGAAVFLAGCATSQPQPSAASPTAPSASAGASGGGPCALDDVVATSEGWSGGAGSLGADVSVENVSDAACALPAIPTLAIFDANGSAVLQSQPRVGGLPLSLRPGGRATFLFQISNWCDESAAFPFHVSVVLADEAAGVGGLPIESAADLPPCLGPGRPAAVSTTDWVVP